MYSYIKGLIVDIQSDHIVLENNGIGYLIYVSNPYAFSKGKEVVVNLYQQVKEDGILLYGFNLKEEKDLFLKLISVKGIGCKSACTMLASGDVEGICCYPSGIHELEFRAEKSRGEDTFTPSH